MRPLLTMSQHQADLTRAEDKDPTDEEFLEDIRRTIREVTVPDGLDVGALAWQAVEKYWDGREKGVIDREGVLIDNAELVNNIAIRRLAEPTKRVLWNMVLTLLLPLAALLALLFSPSFYKATAELVTGYRPSYIAVGALVVIAVLLGFKWVMQSESLTLSQQTMMSLMNGVGATAIVLMSAGFTLQIEATRQQALKVSLAAQRMLEFSRITMEQKIRTGNYEASPPPVQTVPLDEAETLQVTKTVTKDKVVTYKARSNEFPATIEVRIDKDSGEVSVLEDEKRENKAKFFVGTVINVSGNSFILRVDEGQGGPRELKLAINQLPAPAVSDQKVFVTTDPEGKVATQIIGVAPPPAGPSTSDQDGTK